MKESLSLKVGMSDCHNEERAALRHQFLVEQGLESQALIALPFDCSFRRYFRLTNAILMDAPPSHENATQFHLIADILRETGLSVPQVYAADHDHGFLLIEDFGELPYRKAIHQGTSEKLLYTETVKALIHFHQFCHPELVSGTGVVVTGFRNEFGTTMKEKGLPTYSLDLFLEKANFFMEWHDVDFSESVRREFRDLWAEAYLNQPVLPITLAMRDVMIDNLHWLPEREGFKRCGFIDFQDAALAPISYDLVSFLEDARWDIHPSFAKEMLEIYFAAFPHIDLDDFYASYYLWGAQRTVRIMGVFFRKAKRDGMPKYLDYLPHLWKTLERDLSHPSLKDLQKWFKVYEGMP